MEAMTGFPPVGGSGTTSGTPASWMDSSMPGGQAGSATSALAGAGDIISGGMSILSGLSNEEGMFAQGTRYRQQAALDLYQGGAEVKQNQDRAIQAVSSAGAAAGASGITSAGSPAQAARETINKTNVSDAAARFGAKLKNMSDLYEANIQDYGGKQAFFGGLMSGGMQMIEGAALL